MATYEDVQRILRDEKCPDEDKIEKIKEIVQKDSKVILLPPSDSFKGLLFDACVNCGPLVFDYLMEVLPVLADIPEHPNIICQAAQSGNQKLIAHLLKFSEWKKMAEEAVDGDGETCLYYAVLGGKVEILTLLQTVRTDGVFSLGSQPDLVLLLVREGKLEMLKHLIDQHVIDETTILQRFKTLLTEAIEEGHFAIVEYLIDNYVSKVDFSKRKEGLLIEAILNEREAIFSLLINTHLTLDKYAALGKYIALLQKAVVQCCETDRSEGHLLSKLVSDLPDKNLQVAVIQTQQNAQILLVKAACNGNLAFVELLVAIGADPFKHQEQEGWTAFEHAAAEGQVAVLVCFIRVLQTKELSIDFAIKNEWVVSALAKAAEYGKLDAVRYLVFYGANPRAFDKKGWTALHYAAYGGESDVLKYFIIDKQLPIDLAIKDAWGNSALGIAAGNGKLAAVQWLVEHGADICRANNKGSTPLHIAIEKGHIEIVNWILTSDLISEDKRQFLLDMQVDGKNALQLLLASKHFDIARKLVEYNEAKKAKQLSAASSTVTQMSAFSCASNSSTMEMKSSASSTPMSTSSALSVTSSIFSSSGSSESKSSLKREETDASQQTPPADNENSAGEKIGIKSRPFTCP